MNISGVGEMGVGETGVGETGQIIGETGVGEMGVGETGTSHVNVVKPIVSFLGQCRREAGGSWRLRIHMNIPYQTYQRVVALSRHD